MVVTDSDLLYESVKIIKMILQDVEKYTIINRFVSMDNEIAELNRIAVAQSIDNKTFVLKNFE